MRRKFSAAVTLIEALIVILILAIAAGLAYQSSWKAAEKAKENAAWTMLRVIDAAAKAYYRDNPGAGGGSWPPVDLYALTNPGGLVTEGYLADPNQGQLDWTYSLFPAAIPDRGRATRSGGSCAGEQLDRFFWGASDGLEQDSQPACP